MMNNKIYFYGRALALYIHTPLTTTLFELFLLFFFSLLLSAQHFTAAAAAAAENKIWKKIITDKSALISSHIVNEREREREKRNFGGCWQKFRLMTSHPEHTYICSRAAFISSDNFRLFLYELLRKSLFCTCVYNTLEEKAQRKLLALTNFLSFPLSFFRLALGALMKMN